MEQEAQESSGWFHTAWLESGYPGCGHKFWIGVWVSEERHEGMCNYKWAPFMGQKCLLHRCCSIVLSGVVLFPRRYTLWPEPPGPKRAPGKHVKEMFLSRHILYSQGYPADDVDVLLFGQMATAEARVAWKHSQNCFQSISGWFRREWWAKPFRVSGILIVQQWITI